MSTGPASLDFSSFTTLRRDARGGDEAALREAARQFEAVFVRTLLKSTNAVSFGPDGLGEHGDMVRDLRDRQMAEQLTQGKGLGLADMLVRQLGGQAPPAAAPKSDPLARNPALRQAEWRAAAAEPAGFDSPEDFVTALAPHARRAAAELGVSPKVLLAQAALESNWGRQMPRAENGQPSRNLFGIKAAGGWQGQTATAPTREYSGGQAHSETAEFRAYARYADSFADYVDFLRGNPRYAGALQHAGDDGQFLNGLKSAGYATDPDYVDKIQRVAESRVLDDLI